MLFICSTFVQNLFFILIADVLSGKDVDDDVFWPFACVCKLQFVEIYILEDIPLSLFWMVNYSEI